MQPYLQDVKGRQDLLESLEILVFREQPEILEPAVSGESYLSMKRSFQENGIWLAISKTRSESYVEAASPNLVIFRCLDLGFVSIMLPKCRAVLSVVPLYIHCSFLAALFLQSVVNSIFISFSSASLSSACNRVDCA